MLRSMYSGIGGMRGFQNKLDVIGNNIANVNTAGFKKSRTQFQDILSQTMAGGNAPTATAGGTNPKQVGLGSTMAAIDVIHTQGGLMTTNVPSDLAIQGNGFLAVSPLDPGADSESLTNDSYFLTRAGNLSVDAKGNLVTANGMFVLGLQEADGGEPVLTKVNLISGVLGDGADTAGIKVKSFSIGTDGSVTVSLTNSDGSAVEQVNKIFVGTATVVNPGGMEKVGNNLYKVTGAANGNEANDTKLALEPESGTVILGKPNSADRGPIYAGQLEMSNTDLSEEFTEMIVAQRGFQANSRIITTSDSILEELVNLKR